MPDPADDSGVALAVVMIVMALGLLLSAMIVSSTTSALRATSAARAGVQAQAAAEAGVAVALAGVQTGCATTYSSTTAPLYTVKVWSTTSTAATPAPGDWVNGCPTNAAMRIRLISEGTASMRGAVAGSSAGDTAIVEAVYALAPVSDTKTDTTTVRTGASGVALHTDVGSDVFREFSVQGGSGTEKPEVRVAKGNFSCGAGAYIAGDLVVATGSAVIESNCQVNSTARARDDVIVTEPPAPTASPSPSASPTFVTKTGDIRAGRNASLGARAAAGGLVLANGTASISGKVNRDVEVRERVDVTSSAWIAGYLKTDGLLVAQGRIDKWVTIGSIQPTPAVTPPLVAPPATVNDTADIRGDLTTTGDLNSTYIDDRPSLSAPTNEKMAAYLKEKSIVDGRIAFRQPRPTPIPLIPAPTVPAWTDVGYDLATWQKEGFTEETWPVASGCTVGDVKNTSSPLYAFMQKLQTKTTPTVVNALGCPRLAFSSTGDIEMKTDIAFIAKGFDFSSTVFNSSAPSSDRRAWFIVPDQVPGNGVRDCPDSAAADSAGRITIGGGTRTSPTVRALVYTPCQIRTGSMAWRGQFYTHQLVPNPAAGRGSLSVATLGIPGVNLDGQPLVTTSTTTTVTTTYSGPRTITSSAPVSMRNRTTMP